MFGPSNSLFLTPLTIMDFLQVSLLKISKNKKCLGEFKISRVGLNFQFLMFPCLISLQFGWSHIISQKCLESVKSMRLRISLDTHPPKHTKHRRFFFVSKPPCSSGCRRENPLDLELDFLKPPRILPLLKNGGCSILNLPFLPLYCLSDVSVARNTNRIRDHPKCLSNPH